MMALPRNVRELIAQKDAYISRMEQLLSRDIVKYQNSVLTSLINTLSGKLDVKAGVIQNTQNNFRIVGEIERTINEASKLSMNQISGRILNTVQTIGNYNESMFEMVLSGVAGRKFASVAASTKLKMYARIGYVNDRVIAGGFLANFANTSDMVSAVAETVLKSVTTQAGMPDLINRVSLLMSGGEERMGFVERKLKGFAHDLFQQFDAAYGVTLADEFGMNWFIYTGGIIEDSRDFCREFNNQIMYRDQAEEWRTWTPSKAVNIDTFVQNDIYKVPSYIDYAGYEPLIDRGGYNCRHNLAWISDQMAKDMIGEEKYNEILESYGK